MSNNINVRMITNTNNDTPIPKYTAGNLLLSFWSGVAVGVALWVTLRKGNAINERVLP